MKKFKINQDVEQKNMLNSASNGKQVHKEKENSKMDGKLR